MLTALISLPFSGRIIQPKKEREAEAAIYANAAKQANLKHVIWSTLEDVRDYIPSQTKECQSFRDNIRCRISMARANRINYLPKPAFQPHLYWPPFTGIIFIYFGAGPKRRRRRRVGAYHADRRFKNGRYCCRRY